MIEVALVIFFALVVALMVLSSAVSRRRPASAADRLASAADGLGFDFTVDPTLRLYPAMAGQHNGLAVRVWIDYPDNDLPSTFYRVQFDPARDAVPFVLRNRSWLDRFARQEPWPRWEEGEARFGKVRILASDPVALSEYFSSARHQAIVGLLKTWSDVEVTAGSIEVQSGKGVPKEPAVLGSHLDALTEVADVLR